MERVKMMHKRITSMGLLFITLAAAANAGVGESAVITLVFPFGVRSAGMGEVGTALADDESVLFFNPAGLGVKNSGWRRGSVAGSFEFLLPAFKLWELWHAAVAGCYQTPSEIGGIGAYVNYINMGVNPITDELGRERFLTYSYEQVWAFGWGFSFEEFGDLTRHVGFAFKPFVSALAPGLGEHGEGVAQGFAVDVGYLRAWKNGVRYGLNLANMGPSIFYIERDSRDPIPLTANAAIAWKRRFIIDRFNLFRIAMEFRLSKELVINHYDGDPEPFYKAMFIDLFNEPFSYEMQEIQINSGCEFWIMNIGCIRQGILFDYLGERYELHYGLGINLFNHIRGDFAWIVAPEGFLKGFLQQFDTKKEGATGARHYQWQLSLTIDALAGWNEEDRQWWMVNKEREQW
ncbi:MAG: PorV/PorQ family protein [Chitinispirillaceae bacterium]|nr:PorV/PorQ family protein [Chitinispirillaceae bacterium]